MVSLHLSNKLGELLQWLRSDESAVNIGVGIIVISSNVCLWFALLKVLSFPTNCPSCNAPCETNMKLIGMLFCF